MTLYSAFDYKLEQLRSKARKLVDLSLEFSRRLLALHFTIQSSIPLPCRPDPRELIRPSQLLIELQQQTLLRTAIHGAKLRNTHLYIGKR